MKKLIFLLSFLPITLFSQIYVDGVDINADDDIQYCQVQVCPRIKRGVDVVIDYGQEIRSITRRTKIRDKEKDKPLFFSIVGVMNFMGKNGWEVVEKPTHHDGIDRCTFRKKTE